MEVYKNNFYSDNRTSCPCEDIRGTLTCKKKNSIKKFPDDILNLPEECPSLNISRFWGLTLQHQQIKELPKEAFLKFPNLNHLAITNSGLERIDRHAFEGLTDLQTLILKRNILFEIEDGALDNLVDLKYLDLTHNHLLKSYTTEAWQFCTNAGSLHIWYFIKD